MNYIGSKLKLCQDFLPKAICDVCGNDLSDMVFCDIFAGTGIVGRTFKSKVKKVIANDFEYYSYVLNKNYIENHMPIEGKEKYIAELNSAVPESDGFIYKNYCLGGSGERQYFSDSNGKKIDGARIQIEAWKSDGKIDDRLYYFLLCSLLEAADKVANTASVYGAYLKKLKKSAQKEIAIESAEYEINSSEHTVYNEDANRLIGRISGDILYIDPPYNSRQYGANYHLLNTIAEYKSFVPKGKTGLRNYQRSKYCSASTAIGELEALIKKADFKYIFLSYNNEGIMSVDDIYGVMKRYGEYELFKTDYQRFKADSGRYNKSNSTIEYLHVLKK